jgi:hypothetical protein
MFTSPKLRDPFQVVRIIDAVRIVDGWDDLNSSPTQEILSGLK